MSLCSSPRHMIIDHCLYILICWHIYSGGVVSWNSLGIDIDDFPIPLVLEQQAFLILSYDLQQTACLASSQLAGALTLCTAGT